MSPGRLVKMARFVNVSNVKHLPVVSDNFGAL